MADAPKKNKLVRFVRSLVILLVLQEVALRILFPIPELENLDRIYYLNMDSEMQSRAHSRDQQWYWESSVDTAAVFEHVMNRYGFRDSEWDVEKPQGKRRVLFIGDSFVEGVMASQDETITEGFASEAGLGDDEVMNAGMVGTGLDSYLQLAADLVPLYQPETVYLCIYANDLGQTEPPVPANFIEPIYFNPWRPRVLELIRQKNERGTLMPVWGNGSEPYIPALTESAHPWANQPETIKQHVTPPLAEAMLAGHLNPFRVNAIKQEAHYLSLPPALGETVPFFKYVCDQQQAKAVIVYIPTRNQITDHYLSFEHELCVQECDGNIALTGPAFQQHQQVLAQQCAQQGVSFIDLTPTLRAEEAKGNHLFWNYDEHMKGKGYLLIGKTLGSQ